MFNRLRSFLDYAIYFGSILAALLALSGLLGRWVPAFDLINHFQILIFLAAIIGIGASYVWPFLHLGFKKPVRLLLLVPLGCSLLLLGPELYHQLKDRLGNGAAQASQTQIPLKVMSFNIYLGTWSGNALAKTIIGQNPELVFLQEYAPRRFRNNAELKNAFPYQARCQNWRRCTLAILSKHKLTELKRYEIGPQNSENPMHGKMLAATMHVSGGQKVRVYSLHMSWPLPLGRKQTQFADAAEIIAQESVQYPNQIVAGDFNATGWAFGVDRFARALGMERQTHLLPTFPSPNSRLKGFLTLPAFLSLDHVLTSNGITAGPVVRVASPVGDHWPIVTELSLPKL